jgi:hypothetical protein
MYKKPKLISSILLSLSLAACGGGSSNSEPEPPVLNPKVTLATDTTQGIVGTSYALNWELTDVSSCSLEGAVNQTVTASGSSEVTPTEKGSQETSITCGSLTSSVTVEVQPEFIEIPDPVFADALSRSGHPVYNGKMATTDALSIEMLCITGMTGYYGEADENNTALFENTSVPDNGVRCAYTDEYVTDTTGLEGFLNLRTIRLEGQLVEQVDISTLTKLHLFSVWQSPLADIDLSNNTALVYLGISETSLTAVDTSALIILEEASFTQAERQVPYTLVSGTVVYGLSEVDFSNNQKLQRVYLDFNPLTDLGISNNQSSLRELWASGTNIESLDVSGYSALTYIILSESNNLSYLNIYGVNNANVPFRLYLENVPYLSEVIVQNKDMYVKTLDEMTDVAGPSGNAIHMDDHINFVEGP